MAEGKSVSSGSNNNPVSQLCEIPEASSTSGRYPKAPMGSRVVRTVTLVKTNRTAIKALEEGHSHSLIDIRLMIAVPVGNHKLPSFCPEALLSS